MSVSLICKATVSMIKCCRRKHCSSTAALNLQYLKALCSYRKPTLFSHFIMTNCKTRDYSMTNESLNSHLPTQVSQYFTCSPPTLCALEHLLSLHLICLKTGWQHTPHSQTFLAGHCSLSLAYTGKQKGISDSFLFSCSIVRFHWL